MKWKTRITDLFGIEYPIVQGALARIGNDELAVSVSEAGGLGMITAWTLRSPEKLREAIRSAREKTDKPVAVNFSPTMDRYLLEYLDVAIAEKVEIYETAGSRALEFGKRIKDAGYTWIHKVQTVKHARTAEKDGADAICVMGLEGAGLKSPDILTTLVTIPLVVREVSIPVIAAGGIGDARTFLAALALGADGVLLGSVFCAVEESPLTDSGKQALFDADPYDPRWRRPILSTPTLEDLKEMQRAGDSKKILKAAGKAEDMAFPKEARTGAISLAVAFMDRKVTSKQLIDEMITTAEEILTKEGIGGFKLSAK